MTRNGWLVIVLGLVAIYVATNHLLPRLPIDGFVRSYVLRPAMWAALAYVVLRLPRQQPAARRSQRSTLLYLALLVGAFHVAVLVIAGLFSGFGRSPYSFTPTGILTNIVYVGAMLAGIELSRAWLINRFSKNHAVLAIVGATVLFTVINLSATRLLGLGANIESVRYLGNTVFPLLAASLLASYLAYLAGWRAALAYRGVVEAFWWFCPVLPDLSWAFAALVGTAVPIIGMVMINSFYTSEIAALSPRTRRQEGSLGGWLATGIVAVLIIWFGVGLFPVQPVLVGSGSMRPSLDVGDVAIIAKTSPSRIQPGDVIQFRSVEQPAVLHRVIDIEETGGKRYFVTKGDANENPDSEPVLADNVVGVHVYTVRDVGWISVALKELFINRSAPPVEES